MVDRRPTGLLRAACALGLATLATTATTIPSHAGGFGLRDQSSYGQGSSYAGVAAGGSLSSMFWNPATMTQQRGIQSEVDLMGIFPYASNTPKSGTLTGIPGFGGTNDTGDDAFVPSGYLSWQINPRLWLGVSLNSPFGLSVSFPSTWAGRDYGQQSNLKTYNATPSLAYQFNDWLSIGVGVQIEYANASVSQGVTPLFLGAIPLADTANISGKGWGYGFTVGATLTPTPTTTIGIGYRSAINQKLDGTLSVTGPAPLGPTAGSVNTTLNLPDIVSLGLRQRIDSQWTLLGTVEWTNWSRIGTSTVLQGSGAAATIGGKAVTLPFDYKDGWFFSLGAEYQWTERLAVRAGVGYEISPISDDVRIPLLPDNDRTWLSIGSSYHISKDLVVDLAYSHLFVRGTSVDISATSGNPWYNGVTSYSGDVSAHVDIISMGLKYRWDSDAPAPKLITK
ncbi:MAG TPA: outer membrane protein transport protein [Pseudolabrys sp.]|jgi:long-chain fatty acid transport protein